MDTEHFLTCIRAYFPDAYVGESDYVGKGIGQSLTLHGHVMPFALSITHYVKYGEIVMYRYGQASFIKSESRLMSILRKYCYAGWTPHLTVTGKGDHDTCHR